MANQGLFDQVKDFLLGHPELPGAMETLPAPGPDPAVAPEPTEPTEPTEPLPEPTEPPPARD